METKDILKTLRKSKGFANAKEFCDAADISFNTYQNYESGKRLPTAEILMQIADFYGVSTDYLLGREPPANPFDMIAVDTASKNTMEMFASLPEATRKIILDAMVKLAHAAEEAEQEDPDRVEYTCGELEDRAAAQQDGGKFA
jgi:transcriptional regulator with XRE-family HTH domain